MEPHLKLGSILMQCDACDWSFEGVEREDLGQWVDAACPKCGENLLTKGDYARSVAMLGLADVMNTLSLEDIEKLGGKPNGEIEFPMEMLVQTHNGISMEAKFTKPKD